ncbi:MAG: hypothetical protein QXL17_02675 [Candidatus Thermoplasmatota archaeon]
MIKNTEMEITTDNTESNSLNLEQEDSKKLTLKDILGQEINEIVKISKDLQQKIKDAKTKPKKDLYYKKLCRNNDKLLELLVAFNRLTKKTK